MKNIQDLKVVKALEAHRNFARAAEALGMSQPALSRRLASIEQRLGIELFERSRTAVSPTVYSGIIVDRCDAIIDGFEDILQAIEHRRDETTLGLRVSVGPYSAEAVGLESFAAHASSSRAFTGKMLIRDWRTCLEDVIERRSELAITDTRSAQGYPELETETLGGGPIFFFCSSAHPLAQQDDIEWRDVMRFPWATTLIQGRWRELLPENLGAMGRVDPVTGDIVPAICVDSFPAMVAAVRDGRAISAAPSAFIQDEVDRGDLVILPISEPWMMMEYGLVWRRDQPRSKALERFLKTLREKQEKSSYGLYYGN